ncbi:hypothetical protein NQ314_006293 [Rhamnusium bicolor]|uniref:Uncharacterized protein n=1 Tax=Rhamnusium bicolor TaxID=1586634 RepID=A0AAV8Z7R3_9CUCU|nr:hypothetical protein NQ314_006293 [Rhamnusium bicolor]
MVIYNINNVDATLKCSAFLRQLGLSLIWPFQIARLQNPCLRRELRQKISGIHQGKSDTIEVPLGEPAQKW